MLAFLLPFALYLATLAPTIYNLDSAELTTAAATGGLTRATGYPLYLLLGNLWAKLPIADVGYRMNLLSAVSGALTMLFADRILRRFQIGPVATLGALGLLACAPYFWALSLIAEVYTLHTALMAAILLLLLRWAAYPSAGRLAGLALLGGLSMGHHLATALLVPGCLIYVLTTHPRQFLNPRNLLLACGAGILGLSIYLYLPLRAAFAPAFNYLGMYNSAGQFIAIDLSDPRNLWWLMRGGQFTGQMLGYTVQDLVTETRNFGVQLAQSFFVLGLAPGLLGLASLFRRNWQFALALSAMFLLNAGFYIAYRVIDKNTMFLPAYVIWAIWLAAGYQQILTWAGDGTGAVIGRAFCTAQSVLWCWRHAFGTCRW
ncbi:MAG: DUF2723 domain-containing protein [Oscillochloris sp.]|nr:DUF2723 domain-containing protein [Oscillochloris sp.]